jgi:hypothetical protein
MTARPAYEYLRSVQAPMLSLFDPFSRTYRFLYRQHSRWNLDTWIQEEISQGRARLYLGDFSVFTVIDDLGREVVYMTTYGNTDLLAGAIAAGPGVHESLGRFTHGRSPTELDREYRDQRAQNEAAAAPPPPPPEAPGDGAVAAAGAESREAPPSEPARLLAAEAQALPALAALLAVGDDGGTGAAPNLSVHRAPTDDAPALLRALLARPDERPRNLWVDTMRDLEAEEAWSSAAASLWNLSAPRARARPATSPLTQLLAVSALLDLSGGTAWGDEWAPAPASAAAPRPKPQKYVADLVIADKIRQGATCSITMEPLSSCPAGPACVAPCYHCFDKEAIQEWLQRNETCPECRQPCGL